ncbi:TPA: hypothetical protein DCX15_05695 [bacterium]|nr:hypothetical protein [bacterium]
MGKTLSLVQLATAIDIDGIINAFCPPQSIYVIFPQIVIPSLFLALDLLYSTLLDLWGIDPTRLFFHNT